MYKVAIKLTVAVVIAAVVVGCGSHRFETGHHDWNKVQVQFYAPPGATVTVAHSSLGGLEPDRSHQISPYGDKKHKLELTPEEFAVFNLSPGDHEFKYTSAGWDGVSVYFGLEVPHLDCWSMKGARTMLNRCFIPIALPAPSTLDAVGPDDDIYPYQSPAYRLKISHLDVARLAAGDMVTKVVFVADLKKAEEKRNELEIKLTKLRGKRKRLRALISEAKLDFLGDPKSKKFIKLDTELTELDQRIAAKEDRKERLEALLRGDKVLIRREMLVLATDELLPTHEDPVASASELGEVVLIMRLGGRHQNWGSPAHEATAFNR